MFMLNFRSNDASKPSFFEMYAQHELVVRMKPALHYIFSVLSMRYPDRFQWLVNCTDEVFYSVQLLVEKFYLEHYGPFLSFASPSLSVSLSHSKNHPIAGSSRVSISFVLCIAHTHSLSPSPSSLAHTLSR